MASIFKIQIYWDLENVDFSSCRPIYSQKQNLRLYTKFYQNPMIRCRDIKKNIFKLADVRHIEFSKFACIRICFCFLTPNFALIGQ